MKKSIEFIPTYIAVSALATLACLLQLLPAWHPKTLTEWLILVACSVPAVFLLDALKTGVQRIIYGKNKISAVARAETDTAFVKMMIRFAIFFVIFFSAAFFGVLTYMNKHK